LENKKINSLFQYRKSLFKRLGFLVVIFTATLTGVLLYQFHYSFSTQDSILDAHENYYYSSMVEGWGSPPDTLNIIRVIENLHMWCGIYSRDMTEYGIAEPGQLYWSNIPKKIKAQDFVSWTISTDFEEMYDINIPLKVFYGEINTMPVTVVDNGEYLFYLVIDYIPPSDLYNYIIAIILAIIFILGLYFFISHYLKPVQYMKDRIKSLEEGDLHSKIKIIGEDELADLSKYMNKMINEINLLLENKHQLLLEVSHELRSPLTRMQFLIEMIPEHKNINKLREEVSFLEGMIDNLLLSDRLSMPYSNLNLQPILCKNFIKQIIELFPSKKNIFNIKNSIPNEFIKIDEKKFIIAIRNLLDNAIKYGNNKQIIFEIKKNQSIEFHIRDFGVGVSAENIQKLTEPFFQENKTVSISGFGLGLTICKKIIESHQGTLSIKSNIGEGSTFTIAIPL
tara:strand:+ start:7278 stop:8633 length:1356 start_codon:yes stop_codon:yes gene_type:complete